MHAVLVTDFGYKTQGLVRPSPIRYSDSNIEIISPAEKNIRESFFYETP